MVSRLKNPIVLAAVLCAVLLYSGILRVPNKKQFKCLADRKRVCLLFGKIAGNPVRTSSGTTYIVKVKPIKAVDVDGIVYSCTGEISAFISKESVEAYYPGKLFSLSRKKGYLLCEAGAEVALYGKFSRGEVFSVKRVKMIGWGRGVLSFMRRIRAASRSRFRSLMAFWGGAGGLLLALLSGMREYTEGELREAFRQAGLSHILALSGMHLSLVAGAALTTGTLAFGRRAAYFFSAAAVTAFVYFSGFSPSLTRSFIMSSMLLAMTVTGVAVEDLFSVLCVTFLLHTVLSPSDIMTAAFMLSYGALAGIITIGDMSKSITSRLLPPVVSFPLSASIGAQAAAIPISLYLFGEFMPIGIIASVIVSPLVVLFIYLGIAFTVLSLIIPPLATPSGAGLGLLYSVIKSCVLFFARFPAIHI